MLFTAWSLPSGGAEPPGPESAKWINLLKSEDRQPACCAQLVLLCRGREGRPRDWIAYSRHAALVLVLRGYLTEGRTWLEKAWRTPARRKKPGPSQGARRGQTPGPAAGRFLAIASGLEESVEMLRRLGEHRALASL